MEEGGESRRPGTTSGRRGGEKRGRRKQRKREEKEAGGGGEGPAPPGFFLGWASPGPLPDRRPRLLAGLTGDPPSPRVQLCAAQRTGPRLAPRASPSGALLLQAARARAHIHTLALRACAVGGAAPGRLLPPPRVGSASAGRRAVSEREASQRASERAGESQRERLGSQLQAAPSSAAPARLSQDTAATAATTAPQHRHLGRRPRPPRPSPAAAPRRRQEVVGGDHG